MGYTELNEPGEYYHEGLKKKNKLLLKIYKNGISNFGIYMNTKIDLVIRKHLSIDSAIKYLISRRQITRLNELSVEWAQEGIIKQSKIYKL